MESFQSKAVKSKKKYNLFQENSFFLFLFSSTRNLLSAPLHPLTVIHHRISHSLVCKIIISHNSFFHFSLQNIKKRREKNKNKKNMKYDGRKFILKLVGKTNLTHSRDSSLFPSKEESKKFNEIVLCGVDSKFKYLSLKLIFTKRRALPQKEWQTSPPQTITFSTKLGNF